MKAISTFNFLICISLPTVAQQQTASQANPTGVDTSGFYRFTQEWMNLYHGPDATNLVPMYSEDPEMIYRVSTHSVRQSVGWVNDRLN
jgi:hypothetical protein